MNLYSKLAYIQKRGSPLFNYVSVAKMIINALNDGPSRRDNKASIDQLLVAI